MKLKMKSRLLMSVLLGILLMVAPILAQDFTFKLGEDANFIIACDVNGVPCSPASGGLCNFTLRNPDGDYIVDFQPMTLSATGDANYTVHKRNLTVVSEKYPGKVYCTEGGINKTVTFTAAITPSGEDRGYGIFLVLGGAALLTLVIGIRAENEWIGFMAGVLFIITGIYAMINGIGNLADLYTRAIAFTSIGLGLLFVIAAGYKVLEGERGW
jgi:hypothetical protein